MCILGQAILFVFAAFAAIVLYKCFFDSDGIVPEMRQAMREHAWYKKNEPWRYKPYRSPDCPINKDHE